MKMNTDMSFSINIHVLQKVAKEKVTLSLKNDFVLKFTLGQMRLVLLLHKTIRYIELIIFTIIGWETHKTY